MKHLLILGLVGFVAWSAGCSGPVKPGFLAPAKAQLFKKKSVTMIPPKPPDGGPDSDMEGAVYEQYAIVHPPSAVTELYVGPNPGKKTVDWTWQEAQAPADTTVLRLTNGWFLFRGYWPMAETDVIVAGTEGTSFIVQVEDGVSRVYLIDEKFLQDDKIIIGSLVNNAELVLTANNSYIETSDGITFVDSAIQNSSQQGFVQFVRDIEAVLK